MQYMVKLSRQIRVRAGVFPGGKRVQTLPLRGSLRGVQWSSRRDVEKYTSLIQLSKCVAPYIRMDEGVGEGTKEQTRS